MGILANLVSRGEAGDSSDSILKDIQTTFTPYLSEIEDERERKKLKKGYFDRLILKLLEAVSDSPNRDEFLNIMLGKLSEETENRAADYYLLLDGWSDASRQSLDKVKIKRIIGGHPAQQGNLLKAFEGKWENSPLCSHVLLKHKPISFYLSDVHDKNMYDNEFFELHGKRTIWISATPLPASAMGYPDKAIVAIYGAESRFNYRFPPGAIQEWQLMEALPAVYSMLNHQLSTVAEKVSDERRKLVMELAPGAINHEVGAGLRMMLDGIDRMIDPAKQLATILSGNPHFEKILEEILQVKHHAKRGKRIADAFNNLEKRNSASKMRISTIIDEIALILEHSFQKKLTEFVISIPIDFEIETDSALIEHVILNVVINALDAIGEMRVELMKPGLKWTIMLEANLTGENVEILIANDGPSIDVEVATKVFQKGITTKPHGHGHGQGLYICRLVASHLGGEFGFGAAKINGELAPVCFKFSFPRVAKSEEDILSSL